MDPQAYTRIVPSILGRPGCSEDTSLRRIGDMIRGVLRCEPPMVIPLENASVDVSREEQSSVAIVTFHEPRLEGPGFWCKWGSRQPLTPQQCRIMKGTYASNLYVKMHIHIQVRTEAGGTTHLSSFEREVMAGSIPIPVGCEVCTTRTMTHVEKPEHIEPPFTTGQFITGTSRFLTPTECMRENADICFAGGKRAELRMRRDQFSPINYLVVKAHAATGGLVVSQSTAFRGEVPITTVLAALGFATDREVLDLVFAGVPQEVADILLPVLAPSFVAREVLDVDAGLAALAARKSDDVSAFEAAVPSSAVVPGRAVIESLVPGTTDPYEKALTVARVALRFIMVDQGVEDPDDRDSMCTKGALSALSMYAELFRMAWRKCSTHYRAAIKSDLQTTRADPSGNLETGAGASNPVLERGARRGMLLNAMRRPIATGIAGGLSSKRGPEVRISDAANPMNKLSAVSIYRKIHQNQGSGGGGDKCTRKREITPDMFGFICGEDTPDGANVGQTKALSMSTVFAEPSSPDRAREAIVASGLLLPREAVACGRGTDACVVMLNGVALGFTGRPIELSERLRAMKRRAQLHPHTGIVWTPLDRKILVSTDHSRIVRPLYVVGPGGLDKETDTSWIDRNTGVTDLVARGLIEYVDPREAMSMYVAFWPRDVSSDHTHCEIHPGMIHDACMTVIPYPEMSQSPRNAYQSGMGKQALSNTVGFNCLGAVGSLTYMQPFAQSTLITNLAAEWCGAGASRGAIGFNARVVVMPYEGKGSEDPTQYSRAALDAGMGLSVAMVCEVNDCCSNTGSDETYGFVNGVPPPASSVCGPDGLPIVGRSVEPGDVIVSKYAQRSTPQGVMTRQRNVTLNSAGMATKHKRTARVDSFVNEQGQQCCSVYTSYLVETKVGDKSAARHGQKGVISAILNPEDMPYDDRGRFDVIINPHALPSRMTIGMLLEMLMSELAISSRETQFVEPFNSPKFDDVGDALEALGLSRDGTSTVYCGKTAQPIRARVFSGFCHYHKLRHMVSEKVHSRSVGPLVYITRQPSEGRSKFGGLRLGEMERDVLIAHGCASSITGKYTRDSDKFEAVVCALCGNIAHRRRGHANDDEGSWCQACQGTSRCVETMMPWCFKLLTQEVQGLGVNIRFPVE